MSMARTSGLSRGGGRRRPCRVRQRIVHGRSAADSSGVAALSSSAQVASPPASTPASASVVPPPASTSPTSGAVVRPGQRGRVGQLPLEHLAARADRSTNGTRLAPGPAGNF